MRAALALLLAVSAAAPARAADAGSGAADAGRGAFLDATGDVLWLDHADLRDDGAWLLDSAGVDVDAVVEALIGALGDADADRAAEAAAFLGDIGPRAYAAVPALVEDLRGARDPDRRAACAAALGRIAVGGVSAAPLAAALEDANPFVRVAAARALGRAGGGSARARAALAAARRDADERVRLAASDALASLAARGGAR